MKKKSDITEVFESGLKLYSKNFLFRYRRSEDVAAFLPFHVLTALSKKQLGAVKRNRLKRICKSSMFQAMKNLKDNFSVNMKFSYNIVIHVKDSIEQIPEPQRILEFEEILQRLVKFQ